MIETISIVINFDSITIQGQFFDNEAASAWVSATLARLLTEYPILPSSRIEIRRH